MLTSTLELNLNNQLMKKAFLTLSLLFSLAIGAKAQQKKLNQEKAPVTFEKVTLNKGLLSLDGNHQTFEQMLKTHKGKTIVIDLWASWCPDCIKGIAGLEKIQKKFPDAAYVFLSFDKTESAWKAGIEKYQLKGHHYFLNDKMKSSFGESLNINWIPRYILIDKKGIIAHYNAITTEDKKFLETLNKLEK